MAEEPLNEEVLAAGAREVLDRVMTVQAQLDRARLQLAMAYHHVENPRAKTWLEGALRTLGVDPASLRD